MKKKKLLLLAILSLIMLPSITAKAKTSFYEAEYIPNIYINRKINGKIYYQQARYMREVNTNRKAYCLEPFTDMHPYHDYEETISPRHLSEEQMAKIKRAVYLGYNPTGTRNSDLWYVVTQIKIWQIAYPSGSFYFVDSLNGNLINSYDHLLNELEQDIENFSIQPSFANTTVETVQSYPIIIKDDNNVISNYQSLTKDAEVYKDYVSIKNLDEGKYTFTFQNKTHPSGDIPILFYQSETSQNIINVGNINPDIISLDVIIQKTKIKLLKLDADTKSKEPQKNTSLDGAIYELKNAKNQVITNLTIKNNEATIENIPYGKYYLKELQAGTGYSLDETTYEIEISKDNPIHELTLTNKVIKAKIEINKEYLINDTFEKEANIEFSIYDTNHNIVEKITTDENGHAETTLNYGTYLIEQTSTTPNYDYVEPFQINIESNLTLTYNLKNYEIEIPKTSVSKEKKSFLASLLHLLYLLIIKRV